MADDLNPQQRPFLRPPASSPEEVRASVRFPLHLPVEIAPQGALPMLAVTRDISANGLLLTTPAELPPDSHIEFSIRMPGSVLGTATDVLVQGHGRVVRTYKDSAQNCAAAVIDDYTLETISAKHDDLEPTR